jgi:hypothetical protein
MFKRTMKKCQCNRCNAIFDKKVYYSCFDTITDTLTPISVTTLKSDETLPIISMIMERDNLCNTIIADTQHATKKN